MSSAAATSTPRGRFSHLLPACLQATPNRPQKVLDTPRRLRLLSVVLHGIPLLGCIALVVLDRIQLFCFEDDRPNITNFFQLLAKLLELFVLASLSTMILRYARWQLVEEGIPFGLLSPTYRATDVTILLEPSLWTSFYKGRTWWLGLLILLMALYSPLVGPSAAILLIPNADFYDYPGAFGNSTGRLLFMWAGSETVEPNVENTRDYLYPSNLSANSTFNATFCAGPPNQEILGKTYRECPGAVYDSVFHWPWQFPVNNSTVVTEPTYGTVYRAISGQAEDERSPGVIRALSSVPNEILIRTLSGLWRGGSPSWDAGGRAPKTPKISTSMDSPVFQPLVQTRCAVLGDTRYLDLGNLNLSSDGLLTFDSESGWQRQTGTSWPVPRAAIDDLLARSSDNPSTARPYVEWIEAKTVKALTQFSIAALVSTVSREPNLALSQIERTLSSCIFSVHWMPSELTLDPNAQFNILTNWTESEDAMSILLQDIQKDDTDARLPHPLNLITIDRDWALLASSGMDHLLVDPRGPLRFISTFNFGPYHLPDGTLNVTTSRYLMETLTLIMTSALTVNLANYGAGDPGVYLFTSKSKSMDDFKAPTAEVLSGVGNVYDVSERTGPIPNVYEIEARVDRHGYSFGKRAASVSFGLAIILIYIGLSVLYHFHTFWNLLRASPDVVTKFSGTHDIITLAMRSQPPDDLKDCGAGVLNRNTWREFVKVRAQSVESNVLELVFKGKGGMVKVEKGTRYS